MKFLSFLLMFSSIIFANTSLSSIYENILLENSTKAIYSSLEIKSSIEKKESKQAKEKFKALVQSWKSVQAFYILGDLDDDYLDTPRYIDIFHEANEDIKKQLDLIISSKEDLKYSLYKNSHKTINALEYILFKKDIKNDRQNKIALIIINTINANFNEIKNGYIKNKNKFIKNEIKSNAIMLNSLIENSYKIKEWRVGDVAGLSRKYKNKPNNKRAEYSISKNSITAIKSILITHKKVLQKQNFENFGTLISSYEVKEELSDAIKYLNDALNNSLKIQNDDFSNAKPLYKSLKKLHATYYISLIGKLKITAKILDADGD